MEENNKTYNILFILIFLALIVSIYLVGLSNFYKNKDLSEENNSNFEQIVKADGTIIMIQKDEQGNILSEEVINKTDLFKEINVKIKND